MIKAATLSLRLTLLLATISVPSFQVLAQESPQQTAAEQAVYREANRVAMRQKLVEARNAQDRRDLTAAAKIYDEVWDLAAKTGFENVRPETDQARAGLVFVRMELAREAQRAGNLKAASTDVNDVLRVDKTNPQALEFKRLNDKLVASQAGKIPSDEAKREVLGIITNKVTVGTLVQDGVLFYQMDKLDEAQAKLEQAVKLDPQNQSAYYYLNLITEARFQEILNKRDVTSRQGLLEVEKAWATPPKGALLPQPNLYARTNLIHTSKGRQAIVSKLDRIRLEEVRFDGLPLSEVVINLSEQAKKRDPEKRGINFIVNPNVDSSSAASAGPAPTDPNTGLPIPQQAPEVVDIGAASIKLNPPLTDVRMADVLDAIVKVADKPVKYSIEDYAVVFSAKGHEAAPLYPRIIKVDPNTFMQGLESVVGMPFADIQMSSGSGGGSGGSSGSSSSSGSGGNVATSIPRVTLAGGGTTGGGGTSGGSTTGGGVHAVTRTNAMETVSAAARGYFMALGVDLNPPKSIFFNDREGTLIVRATLQDLDIIEAAVQVLNIAPPLVNIKTKFVEVSQNDNRALGFDWYLGNVLMNHNAMGLSGGTAPSYSGQSTTANPLGIFPGTVTSGSATQLPVDTTIPPSASDGLITSGLRNTINAPALATFSGILTDPQFRVVVHALEQRDGVDLLNESSVTTLSGRQTQIQVVDMITIVTGTSVNQNQSQSTGLNGGSGVVGSTINYPTSVLPFGPTLDVIPYVSADGFTIQMTIIPTITEFLGYDDPGKFIPQAQSAATSGVGIPLTAQLPLPHFRLRQVTTSAIVWDGQTVVLGGLITENVTKLKDKVPLLGDLPLFGRLFRSESSSTQKKNLMIFVTPTIIDPAGNRFHSDDEMPFNPNSIPVQKPLASAAP